MLLSNFSIKQPVTTVAIIIVPWAYLEFGGGRKRV